MTQISVLSFTQRIVVDPFSSAVALFYTGPRGLQGPQGPAGAVIAPLDINAVTDTAYTFVLSDGEKLVTHDDPATSVMTIPLDASVGFPLGTRIHVSRLGLGSLTISPDDGVTLNYPTSNVVSVRYQTVTIIKLAPNTWLLSEGLT